MSTTVHHLLIIAGVWGLIWMGMLKSTTAVHWLLGFGVFIYLIASWR